MFLPVDEWIRNRRGNYSGTPKYGHFLDLEGCVLIRDYNFINQSVLLYAWASNDGLRAILLNQDTLFCCLISSLKSGHLQVYFEIWDLILGKTSNYNTVKTRLLIYAVDVAIYGS